MYRLRQYFNKFLPLQFRQQQQYHSPCKDDGGYEFDGCIPVERIEKRFVRSSGPGGQNVNMVNTKCQIRFNLKKADWLSPEIHRIFRRRFARLLNNQDDVIVSSDKSRIQAENQEDCFKKLQVMLLECNKELLESRPPTNQDRKILDERARKAAQRRLHAKRFESQKKKNRDPHKFI